MKPSAFVFLFSLSLIVLSARADMQGVYYIGSEGTKPQGGTPDFPSLKAACDSLNAVTGGIAGDCTFLITGNLTEPANCALGVNTNGYTITFKPAPGVSPVVTFTKTSDNSGISGAWVIGSSDLTKQTPVTTNKIVIDGSNGSGSTRDLTITTAEGCNGNTIPLRLYGDVNMTVIKNCIVRTGQPVASAILLTVRSAGGINYVPDDIVIENCAIRNTTGSSGQGIAISNSGTPTAYPSAVVLRNNLIEAASRGIFLNYAGNTDIDGNEIRITQTGAGSMSYGIHGNIIGSSANTTTIRNNRLTCLSTVDCADGTEAGITGIHCGSKGTYHVYNNMISGFAVSGQPVPMKMIGIRTAVSANIYFNSIYLPGLSREKTDKILYCGIYASGGTAVVKNNIICAHEESDSSFAVWYSGGTLNADYNDYHLSGMKGCTGSHRGVPKSGLLEWRAASGGDAHSTYADPAAAFGTAGSWLSRTDLHWRQTPSPQFAGVAITGITVDIDGHARNPIPTMGADESDAPLPVELTSFSAEYRNGTAFLQWITASELNNYGFEIEREELNDKFQRETGMRRWTAAGFVQGHGTTDLPHFYEFADKADYPSVYRLKQIDRDGGFRYSPETEAVSDETQVTFALEQNYPNPFNPETEIQYTIPTAQHVTLAVYDAGGREVAALVDTFRQAGTHAIVWDASTAPAGIYFYRLQAGKFLSVKKLVLIK